MVGQSSVKWCHPAGIPVYPSTLRLHVKASLLLDVLALPVKSGVVICV